METRKILQDLIEMFNRMESNCLGVAKNHEGEHHYILTGRAEGLRITITEVELSMKVVNRIEPEEKQITFDEFVKHGLNYPGVNIHNGMPWSFNYEGFPVTHENDNLYLIIVPSGPPVRFNRNCVLFTNENRAWVK